LLIAYSESYQDETCDGVRDAGIDDSTLAEGARLIGRAFGYAEEQPKIVGGPRSLNDIDLDRADRVRKKYQRRLAENPHLLDTAATKYQALIDQGVVTSEVARRELGASLQRGGLGTKEAYSAVDEALSKDLREAKEEAGAWMDGLRISESGDTAYTYANVMQILRLHPDYKDKLWWDDRACKPMCEDTEIDEKWILDLCTWLAGPGIKMQIKATSCAGESVVGVCAERSKDPFREYLEGLEWDGELRLDEWLIRYGGAQDTPWVRVAGSKTLISAVARAYEPGCKVDTMLVLQSDEQGVGKSRLVASLLAQPHWLVEGKGGSMGDKDTIMRLHGPVIVEVAELDWMRGREASEVKSALSTTSDTIRPPYGRTYKTLQRRSIMIGTTNEHTYLHDKTGNRRIWPITVLSNCDPEGCASVRDQLWAEATARYKDGEQWWLTKPESELAVQEQLERTFVSPLEERLREVLDLPQPTGGIIRIHEDCLDKNRIIQRVNNQVACQLAGIENPKNQDYKQLAEAMRGLGWELVKSNGNRYYVRPGQEN
jgi:hypothetical protein